MPCHDTKGSAGLHRFIPDSKTITINRHLFSFLYIAFYWNNNLSYVLASQKKKGKHILINTKERLPCLFRDFSKYKTIVLRRRPYFTPVRANVTICLEKLTYEPS